MKKLDTNKTLLIDSAKAALPVGGGGILAFLKFSDEYVTYATHWVGLGCAVVGFIWYVHRFKNDLKSHKNGNSKTP